MHTGHKNPTETTMHNRMLFQTPNNATNQADPKKACHTIATRRLTNGLISTRIQKKASNTLVGARTTK